MRKMKLNMYDLILCLTDAADLVCPEVANHHKQVAYLAFRIGEEFGLSAEQQRELLLAGLLHDIGAFSVQERLELLEFEENSGEHTENGACMVGLFPPLAHVADIIRYHHKPWNNDNTGKKRAPLASHILHLADRVAVRIDRGREVLGQVEDICAAIQAQSGEKFMPELVDAFLRASQKEYIWLDLAYGSVLHVMPHVMVFDSMELSMEGLIGLSHLFACIIDFRSPFTANHSSGVAASAERLAELAGFSPKECRMMRVAGYLHDLGKIAVVNDVLEKPDKLNEQEYNTIRSHTYYTYRTLQNIEDFDTINQWASLHHERLDGSGYPFHLTADNLPLGSRIMAVADVFTAITEDRPYRAGMGEGEAREVLRAMVADKILCPYVVSLMDRYFDDINAIRIEAQRQSDCDYRRFLSGDMFAPQT